MVFTREVRRGRLGGKMDKKLKGNAPTDLFLWCAK
jgi:hypothetical protein